MDAVNTWEKAATRKAFHLADAAWGNELGHLFGRAAGSARYTRMGQGRTGTKLYILYRAREAARLAWEKIK